MSCIVCGSENHEHCAMGCSACDDPKSPHPHYAATFCDSCKESFCSRCLESHQCEKEFDDWRVRDLALREYWGKWKGSRQFADTKAYRFEPEWWTVARLHFLELGGLYREQLGAKP